MQWLCHNLLHFLSSEEIDMLLKKIHACLSTAEVRGSLHLVTASHKQTKLKELGIVKKGYNATFFVRDYKNKMKGHISPQLAEILPEQLHFISRKAMSVLLESNGFTDVDVKYSEMPTHAPDANREAFGGNGKENISAYAFKKQLKI